MPSRRADVFFYGLFMDPDLLRAQGITPENIELAWLDGFALHIGNRATLVPSPRSRVYGLAMSLTITDLQRLYSQTGLEAYQPEAVLAQLAGGGVLAALCYNLPEPPAPGDANAEYTMKLRAVAQKVGLPADYIATL